MWYPINRVYVSREWYQRDSISHYRDPIKLGHERLDSHDHTWIHYDDLELVIRLWYEDYQYIRYPWRYHYISRWTCYLGQSIDINLRCVGDGYIRNPIRHDNVIRSRYNIGISYIDNGSSCNQLRRNRVDHATSRNRCLSRHIDQQEISSLGRDSC